MWNYSNTPSPDSMCHYGILGMKWGRRKAKTSNTSPKPKRKNIKEMSDNELRQRINRIQMEKQYKQLTSTNVFNGKKFVTNVITNAAQQTASKYVSQYMNKGVETLINRVIKK